MNGIRTDLRRHLGYMVKINPVVATPAAADLRRAIEAASRSSVLVLPPSAYRVEIIEPRAFAVPERVRVVAGVGGRRGRARRRRTAVSRAARSATDGPPRRPRW